MTHSAFPNPYRVTAWLSAHLSFQEHPCQPSGRQDLPLREPSQPRPFPHSSFLLAHSLVDHLQFGCKRRRLCYSKVSRCKYTGPPAITLGTHFARQVGVDHLHRHGGPDLVCLHPVWRRRAHPRTLMALKLIEVAPMRANGRTAKWSNWRGRRITA